MSCNINVNDKKLYCVVLPGIVKNPDKAISLLGGLKCISETFFEDEKLAFRLGNGELFRKPARANKTKIKGLYIKIIREQKPGSEEYSCTINVIGKVVEIVNFSNLANFQCIPVIQNGGRAMDICEDLLPSKITHFTLFNKSVPEVFVSSGVMNRSNTFWATTYLEQKDERKEVCMIRNRLSQIITVRGDEPVVPSGPPKNVRNDWKFKAYKDHLIKLQQLFEERPAWTTNALICVTGLPRRTIRDLLVAVAYYIRSGPFRVVWVRYGFDLRKNFGSRIYQVFDYRMRGGVERIPLKLKRWKEPKYQHAVDDYERDILGYIRGKVDDYCETSFIFKPGFIPPMRQIFYQLCDMKIPEVEKVLSAPQSAPYSTKYGWFPPKALDRIRIVVDRYVADEFTKNNITLDKNVLEIDEDIREDEEESSSEYEESVKSCPTDSDDDEYYW